MSLTDFPRFSSGTNVLVSPAQLCPLTCGGSASAAPEATPATTPTARMIAMRCLIASPLTITCNRPAHIRASQDGSGSRRAVTRPSEQLGHASVAGHIGQVQPSLRPVIRRREREARGGALRRCRRRAYRPRGEAGMSRPEPSKRNYLVNADDSGTGTYDNPGQGAIGSSSGAPTVIYYRDL